MYILSLYKSLNVLYWVDNNSQIKNQDDFSIKMDFVFKSILREGSYCNQLVSPKI